MQEQKNEAKFKELKWASQITILLVSKMLKLAQKILNRDNLGLGLMVYTTGPKKPDLKVVPDVSEE